MKNFKEAKKTFLEYLRKNNLKITDERKKILEEVFKINEHFDAESLYLKFKNENINISRATIYRTLELLVDSQLISKIRFSDNMNKYEHIFGEEHHSHLICKSCGKIIEFIDNRVDTITMDIAEKYGYTDLEHNFRIYGLCASCRKKLKDTTQ